MSPSFLQTPDVTQLRISTNTSLHDWHRHEALQYYILTRASACGKLQTSTLPDKHDSASCDASGCLVAHTLSAILRKLQPCYSLVASGETVIARSFARQHLEQHERWQRGCSRRRALASAAVGSEFYGARLATRCRTMLVHEPVVCATFEATRECALSRGSRGLVLGPLYAQLVSWCVSDIVIVVHTSTLPQHVHGAAQAGCPDRLKTPPK
jgi:hypothetical protein